MRMAADARLRACAAPLHEGRLLVSLMEQLVDQAHHGLDDIVQSHVRRVEDDCIGGLGQRRRRSGRVLGIPLAQRGLGLCHVNAGFAEGEVLLGTTMPTPACWAADTSARCRATSLSLTAGTALTALTAAVTSSPRIGPDTSTSPTWIDGCAGSQPLRMDTASEAEATASGSSTLTCASSMAHVMARYIAPVSR
jgi:hypothetical protein